MLELGSLDNEEYKISQMKTMVDCIGFPKSSVEDMNCFMKTIHLLPDGKTFTKIHSNFVLNYKDSR